MNRTCQTQVKIIELPTVTQRARRRWVLIFAAASVVMLALAVPLTAQTFRGNILGTVTDPNGAVVPEATVTAKNMGTGIERSTVTDSSGNYTLAELQTGTYVVTAEKPGFAKYQIDSVVVEVTSEKRVDIELSVAGSDTVVLVAPAAQVETTTNTLGGTISTKAVADLPVNGRDFTKFLVLVPGATGDPSGATDSPGSFGLFSANGNRGRANNYLLDGTNIFNHPNFSSPLLPGFSADASFNGIDSVTGRGQGFLPITVTPDVGIGNPFLGGGGPRNIQLAVRLLF